MFVYGTLLFPALVRAVTGASYPQRAARLAGFARYAVHGEPFPGLIEEAGAHSDGSLLEGVGGAALDALDRFEGPQYERRRVVVQTAGGPRGALVYVFAAAHRHRLSRERWSPEAFAASHLELYLARGKLVDARRP
jgi:gamma-glutamylcyclotransferase (GGCT)/AIG2-like uncharacterized protein YtfP